MNAALSLRDSRRDACDTGKSSVASSSERERLMRFSGRSNSSWASIVTAANVRMLSFRSNVVDRRMPGNTSTCGRRCWTDKPLPLSSGEDDTWLLGVSTAKLSDDQEEARSIEEASSSSVNFRFRDASSTGLRSMCWVAAGLARNWDDDADDEVNSTASASSSVSPSASSSLLDESASGVVAEANEERLAAAAISNAMPSAGDGSSAEAAAPPAGVTAAAVVSAELAVAASGGGPSSGIPRNTEAGIS